MGKVHVCALELQRVPQAENGAGQFLMADKKYHTETEKLVELMQQASERRDLPQMLITADEVLRREPANVDAMYVAGTALMLSSQEGLGALILNAGRCATQDPIKLGAIWNNLGWCLQKY